MSTLIATDTHRLSNVLKWEEHPTKGVHREVVTVNEASAVTYKLGQVLGKVTATGKYKIVDPAATDGSEKAAGIYIATGKLGESKDVAIAANTDTQVLILARGDAIVADGGLVYGAGVDSDAEKAAIKADLAALRIFVEKQI